MMRKQNVLIKKTTDNIIIREVSSLLVNLYNFESGFGEIHGTNKF